MNRRDEINEKIYSLFLFLSAGGTSVAAAPTSMFLVVLVWQKQQDDKYGKKTVNNSINIIFTRRFGEEEEIGESQFS